MEQQLWFLRQRFAALQDYRREVQRLWRDTAAHELNGRYFNPHETDGETLQTELSAQLSALDKAAGELAQADASAQEAAEHAENVDRRLIRSHDESMTAYQYLDVYGRSRAESETLFSVILNTIDTANGCCNDIVADPQGAQSTLRQNPNAGWAGRVKRSSIQGKYSKGVPFDSEGYPDFSAYAIKTVRIEMQGINSKDFPEANRAAGYAETPDGYTWHHHQDRATMQLVPRDLHEEMRHAGGHQQIKLLGVLKWT
jgi:Skp family chaperone for outer membrane proteins